MSRFDTIATAVLFQLGWFGCVFAERIGFPALAFLFPASLIGFLHFKGHINLKVVRAALIISVIGILFDGVVIQLGLVSAVGVNVFMMPLWLLAMWFLFSFAMVKLGASFRLPLWILIALGAVFGPLTYLSGEALEVLTFTTKSTLWIYAGFWAVAFPAVIQVSRRIS